MNDGQPLIERGVNEAACFTSMAERIARNPQEFGGACVIVPPGGGDPIEFMLIDTKGDVAQFYATVMTKVQVVLEGLKERQRAQPGMAQWR